MAGNVTKYRITDSARMSLLLIAIVIDLFELVPGVSEIITPVAIIGYYIYFKSKKVNMFPVNGKIMTKIAGYIIDMFLPISPMLTINIWLVIRKSREEDDNHIVSESKGRRLTRYKWVKK